MSELAQQLIEENFQSKNPYLDLGNCGLYGTEEILNKLGECAHLEVLVLSNSWEEWNEEQQKWKSKRSQNKGKGNLLTRLPIHLPSNLRELYVRDNSWEIQQLNSLKALKRLIILTLDGNQINDLTPLKELRQLKELSLNDNQINDLTPLKELRQLKELSLNDNQINDLTPLKELKQLKKLSLNNNQIGDLAPIKELKQLRNLSLSNNQINDFILLEKLNELIVLNLGSNQVNDLTPLKELKKLGALVLSNNQINDLTPLKELKQLKILFASNNQIKDLQAIKDLKQLTHFVLRNNQIKDLQAIKDLKQLIHLSLRNNQIKDLQAIQELKQLTTLVLSHNQITQLNLSFFQNFPQLEYFSIQDNPIKNIPREILHQGLDEIKDYLQSIEDQGEQRALNEAKLIFVGVGEVGKTELADAISDPAYEFDPDRETTKGIRIKQWMPPNCTRGQEKVYFIANIWDFAGQEINYGTHQFFLTKNSVYVFVWETRKEE